MLVKIYHKFLLFWLLLLVFLSYANRVDDLDLWWHLKSGELIYKNLSIPEEDPFSFTYSLPPEISRIGIDEVPPEERPSEEANWFWATSLKRNWLSQVLFYLTYLGGGFIGLGILKSLLFISAYMVLYLTMLRRGADHAVAFIVLCLVAYIGHHFNYTRPQLFSYLLLPVTLYCLYDLRRGGRFIYILPLVMLLWANLHGGYILGLTILGSFTFVEALKYLIETKTPFSIGSTMQKAQLKKLIIIVILSIAITLLNPNTYLTFLFPWYQEQSLFRSIEEYHRPMLYEYHSYWLMLSAVIIMVLVLSVMRRMDLTELLILTVVIIPSLKSNKYIIYFALVSGVFLSYALSSVIQSFKHWISERLSLFRRDFSIPAAVVLSLVMVAVSAETVSTGVLRFDTRQWMYPTGAVAFIKDVRPQGRMFNLYNWGGYLIWELYPEYRVFIYGRTLNETAFFHYHQILKATKGQGVERALWRRLLDAYKINFIVTPAVSTSGYVFPLVDRISLDNEWKPVFADGKALVFVRNRPENKDLIERYEIPLDRIYDEIIAECERGIEKYPATWGYYETLGYAYMKKHRLKDALKMFEKYLSMNPYNQKVRYTYELLRRYLSQS